MSQVRTQIQEQPEASLPLQGTSQALISAVHDAAACMAASDTQHPLHVHATCVPGCIQLLASISLLSLDTTGHVGSSSSTNGRTCSSGGGGSSSNSNGRTCSSGQLVRDGVNHTESSAQTAVTQGCDDVTGSARAVSVASEQHHLQHHPPQQQQQQVGSDQVGAISTPATAASVAAAHQQRRTIGTVLLLTAAAATHVAGALASLLLLPLLLLKQLLGGQLSMLLATCACCLPAGVERRAVPLSACSSAACSKRMQRRTDAAALGNSASLWHQLHQLLLGFQQRPALEQHYLAYVYHQTYVVDVCAATFYCFLPLAHIAHYPAASWGETRTQISAMSFVVCHMVLPLVLLVTRKRMGARTREWVVFAEDAVMGTQVRLSAWEGGVLHFSVLRTVLSID